MSSRVVGVPTNTRTTNAKSSLAIGDRMLLSSTARGSGIEIIRANLV